MYSSHCALSFDILQGMFQEKKNFPGQLCYGVHATQSHISFVVLSPFTLNAFNTTKEIAMGS